MHGVAGEVVAAEVVAAEVVAAEVRQAVKMVARQMADLSPMFISP